MIALTSPCRVATQDLTSRYYTLPSLVVGATYSWKRRALGGGQGCSPLCIPSARKAYYPFSPLRIMELCKSSQSTTVHGRFYPLIVVLVTYEIEDWLSPGSRSALFPAKHSPICKQTGYLGVTGHPEHRLRLSSISYFCFICVLLTDLVIPSEVNKILCTLRVEESNWRSQLYGLLGNVRRLDEFTR